MTDNGDVVTVLYPLALEDTETPYGKGSKLHVSTGSVLFHMACASTGNNTKEEGMPSPRSPESFSSISSLDATHYTAVRKHHEENKARRAAEIAEATATAREVAQDVEEAAGDGVGSSHRQRRYKVV
eukprot:jgi/Tetstr1/436585/TSEL_025382.t1